MPIPTEVFIVEDSLTQAVLLQQLLQRVGYKVALASDGESALERILAQPPDLILSDVMLPGIDGFELCSQIKSHPALRHIPVILLTVLDAPQSIVQGMRAGADNFLVKPYDEKRLLARLRYTLSRAELRSQADPALGVEIRFGGERHFISSDRVEMLELLLDSYDEAAAHADRLKAAAEKAERASQAASELLARAGHEVRAPLNSILGFAQLLEFQEHQGKDKVREILAGGEHLLHIADRILNLTRLEGAPPLVEKEAVDWREAILWSGDVIKPAAALRDVEIIYRLNALEVPPVVADRERLCEALLVLLSNAVKYNRPSGKVVVSGEFVPPSTVRISVADTGIGIPADRLPLLFTPFERLDAETGGVSGLGLGLAIARSLVEAMDGRLTAQSCEGLGSTFAIELPAQVDT